MEEIKDQGPYDVNGNSQDDDYQDFEQIRVDGKQESLRLDKFLMDRLRNVTRNRVQNAIKAGAILVNQKEIKPNYRVRPGDLIDVVVPHPPGEGERPAPQNIPLDILYEDEALLVLNKPAGMVVHPGIGNYDRTLVNALAYHFRDQNLPVLEGNSFDKIGLVHRIDKYTSGLLVVAKTDYAMTHLAKQFYYHTIERKYVAMVWGEPELDQGTIEGHIGRHPKNRMLRHVYPNGDEGKWSVTHYKVLERLYYVTLLECQLETGRTHQIRVHMKYLGHPLFSDNRYGGDQILKGTIYSKYKQFVENCFKILPRQALHAKSLGFEHPMTNKKIYFESELPDDFELCLEKWRNYVSYRRSNLNAE